MNLTEMAWKEINTLTDAQIEHFVIEMASMIVDQMSLSKVRDELVAFIAKAYEADPTLWLDDLEILNLSFADVRRIAKGASK